MRSGDDMLKQIVEKSPSIQEFRQQRFFADPKDTISVGIGNNNSRIDED